MTDRLPVEVVSEADSRPPAVRESHIGKALDNTVKFVVTVVIGGSVLYCLVLASPFILAAAVLLSPIFLFFYIRSRFSRRRER